MSLFAAEGSGSSSSASSSGAGDDRSGDHASSSSGAADAHAAVLRTFVALPEFRTFNEQVDAYVARLAGIVADGGYNLFSRTSLELVLNDSSGLMSLELMRVGILNAISKFLTQVIPGASVTTVKQFARNLFFIAQLSEDILLLYGKDFEKNRAFLLPLLLLHPMEIDLELFRALGLALKDDSGIFDVVSTISAPACDPQMASLDPKNIEAKLTATGVKYELMPDTAKAVFSMMATLIAQLKFFGNLFERIDY
jgi:hypothetical protein